ncbi:MAG: non-canonical purine NTP pyrophosphatase [Acidobacteriota bacterium]
MLPRTVLLASTNPHKLVEIRALCAGFPLQVISPADLDFPLPPVVETGASFEANAVAKATSAADAARAAGRHALWVLADDSGLEVDALGGAPGVHSARYALALDAGCGRRNGTGGERADLDRRNIRRLLAELHGLAAPRRAARFVCVLVLVGCGEAALTVRGEVEGSITTACRGTGRFGYDPVFYHAASGRTFGEMTAGEKAGVSHRGVALRRLRERLPARFGHAARQVE